MYLQIQINPCDYSILEHLIWVAVPFLLGLFLGFALWYPYRNKARVLEQERNTFAGLKNNLQADVESLKAEIERREQHLANLNLELTKVKDQAKVWEEKFSEITSQQKPERQESSEIMLSLIRQEMTSTREKISAIEQKIADLEIELKLVKEQATRRPGGSFWPWS